MTEGPAREPASERDAAESKTQIVEYCKRKGALAVGVADLESIDLVAPPGHRPRDILPGARSVISLGVGGQTPGAWAGPTKAFAYFGSTEGRAYGVASGCSVFLESRVPARS